MKINVKKVCYHVDGRGTFPPRYRYSTTNQDFFGAFEDDSHDHIATYWANLRAKSRDVVISVEDGKLREVYRVTMQNGKVQVTLLESHPFNYDNNVTSSLDLENGAPAVICVTGVRMGQDGSLQMTGIENDSDNVPTRDVVSSFTSGAYELVDFVVRADPYIVPFLESAAKAAEKGEFVEFKIVTDESEEVLRQRMTPKPCQWNRGGGARDGK